MRNSGPSDLFEFDFFISGRAGSKAAQEIAQVLRDADYRVYLPERDIFYGTKFVPGQFEALARSRNLKPIALPTLPIVRPVEGASAALPPRQMRP